MPPLLPPPPTLAPPPPPSYFNSLCGHTRKASQYIPIWSFSKGSSSSFMLASNRISEQIYNRRRENDRCYYFSTAKCLVLDKYVFCLSEMPHYQGPQGPMLCLVIMRLIDGIKFYAMLSTSYDTGHKLRKWSWITLGCYSWKPTRSKWVITDSVNLIFSCKEKSILLGGNPPLFRKKTADLFPCMFV